MNIARLFAVLCASCLVACSSGGPSTTDSTEGALKETGGTSTKTETLLRCNVFESGGGPDQEVTVKRTGTALTLIELTNHGSTVSRDLDEEEWSSHVLKLRQEYPDDDNTLTKEGHSWRNESKSSGWRTVGYADCSIDTTK